MTITNAAPKPDTPHDPSGDERREFVLRIVQPGLAGLMDGSVSTLAPLFAAALATEDNGQTFRIGLAAAVGAGVSMAFAEAMSDDGTISGRGSPWVRGSICGLATAAGGIGHTLPFLLSGFKAAMITATVVVLLELLLIALIRRKYMDTPLLRAMFGTVIGGLIVLVCGILIGRS